MKFATKLIHAGAEPDPSTGAIMTPIYQTSTYVQEAPGVNKGFEYARSQNPTRKALEEALAVIENGKFGLAFSSGVAATDANSGWSFSGRRRKGNCTACSNCKARPTCRAL